MKVPPELDLLAIAVPYLLWPAFQHISPTSGRVAFYCMGGLLVIYSGWRIRRLAGWQWVPVMWFAAFVGSQQAVCGLLFEAKGQHICDSGTGFPWILLTVTALALFAAYYARKRNAGPND